MEKFSLNVKERKDTGKKVKNLKRQGLVPGVLYGHGVDNTNIVVDQVALEKIYEKAGESNLVDLKIDSREPVKVLIQGVQWDVVYDRPIHVDFLQIRMDEEITTEIPLKFVGESAAVKELGGTLVKNFDELEVECLPGDLVPFIEVDLSRLKTFDDVIRVKDLVIPKGMRVVQSTDRSVVVVSPPVSEAELAELEKAPETGVEGVEVVGKEQKEEEAEKPEEPEEEKKEKQE